MSESVELLTQITTAKYKPYPPKSDLSKVLGFLDMDASKPRFWKSGNAVCQNSLLKVKKDVLQKLGFRRVQVRKCCAEHHFLTPVNANMGPRNVINVCSFHDVKLKIQSKSRV